MSEVLIRHRAADAATSCIGLGADPAEVALRQRYIELIAPGEPPNTQRDMARMSGCGLVAAGVWREIGVADARLDPPYRVGTAISRLIGIARDAGAWVPFKAGHLPAIGDMVLVGDNGLGGQEHVFTVVHVDMDTTTIRSVDGGMRDARGYQAIVERTRTWQGDRDRAPGGAPRRIIGWVDVARLPLREPRGEAEEPRVPDVGKPGADSAAPVIARIGGKSLIELATSAFGQPPVFWGRYFTKPDAVGTVEYRHRREDAALRAAGIRVLPIARQTTHVGGSEADGERDAAANAKDLLATFGALYLAAQGGEFYVFLDVEGAPSLSSAYYRGWVRGLDAAGDGITFHPCVYATQADAKTWKALAAAAVDGARCMGLWVAHWHRQRGFHPLGPWDPSKTMPSLALPFPVLIWQYANEAHGAGGFDCNQTNPAIDLEEDLLRYLVLPPA